MPVPEADLPVAHPYLDDFRPDDSGVSPLARATDWFETISPFMRLARPPGHRRHRQLPVQRLVLPALSEHRSRRRGIDEELTRKWLPVDCYIGGNEHAVLHLMYARFITMALNDLGVLGFEEPFAQFRAHGLLIRDGRKMSKSRGNVINPDDIIEEFGADTMRLYLMFLGPYDQVADYQTRGIQGPQGFLNRIWQAVADAQPGIPDADVERALHRTIKQVSEQVPALQFNTAIAAMMEYLNTVRAGGRTANIAELTPLVIMLAPFAPHIAEELYARLGHNGGLFDAARWPAYDAEKLIESSVEVVVQVNGKVRGRTRVPADADNATTAAAAEGNDNVARYLDGATIRKTIVVPGRLVNFVVS